MNKKRGTSAACAADGEITVALQGRVAAVLRQLRHIGVRATAVAAVRVQPGTLDAAVVGRRARALRVK